MRKMLRINKNSSWLLMLIIDFFLILPTNGTSALEPVLFGMSTDIIMTLRDYDVMTIVNACCLFNFIKWYDQHIDCMSDRLS